MLSTAQQRAEQRRKKQYVNVKPEITPYIRRPRRQIMTDEEQRLVDAACRERETKGMNLNLQPCRSLTKEEIKVLMEQGAITHIQNIG